MLLRRLFTLEKITLSDYYGVNPEDYTGISSEVLELPVRISNRFHRYKIETIEDLLMIGWDDIDSWYGFGKGCKDTLEDSLAKFLKSDARSTTSVVSNVQTYIRNAFMRYEVVDVAIESLSRSQRNLVVAYNQAVSTLAKSDVDVFLSNIE